MIKQTIVLTLQESDSRHKAFMGGAASMRIPDEQYKFIAGHDHRDYNEDSVYIANLAENDGFPCVRNYTYGLQSKYLQQTSGSVAQIWNYLRALRHIANGEDTTLLLWDDRMLMLPFPKFNRLIEYLEGLKDFMVFQLRMKDFPLDVRPPSLGFQTSDYRDFNKQRSMLEFAEKERETHSPIFEEYCIGDIDIPHVDLIQKGIMGYEECMVFSPAGAEWFLSLFENYPPAPTDPYVFDHDIWQMSDASDEEIEYASYRKSYFNIDTFICWGLRKYCDEAVEEGKNIYCPSKFGYDFCNDWLAQGTTIDWCPETNPDHAKVHYVAEPQFLNLV